MESVAGSDTSVFAGAFFHDYLDSHMKDSETIPRQALIGSGTAMASNRISHFFDLRGTSITVDTGCSTALAALHLACQSIRSGESNMSVVGGSNVLINPDMWISLSNIRCGKFNHFVKASIAYSD
jgi:acyl transferase domain-containing protein